MAAKNACARLRNAAVVPCKGFSLNIRQRCGAKPCACQILWIVEAARPVAFAIARSVQCVASCGGGLCVSRITSAVLLSDVFGVPGGRLFSCRRPSTPSLRNRCCQRQTHFFDLPVAQTVEALWQKIGTLIEKSHPMSASTTSVTQDMTQPELTLFYMMTSPARSSPSWRKAGSPGVSLGGTGTRSVRAGVIWLRRKLLPSKRLRCPDAGKMFRRSPSGSCRGCGPRCCRRSWDRR